MIKVLLCCEGAADRGRELYVDKEYINVDGVMQNFINKISKRNDLVFVHIFLLVNGQYQEKVVPMHKDLKQPVSCLEGCVIDFQPVVAMRDEMNSNLPG